MNLKTGKWVGQKACLNCDKDKECVAVTCESGTFSGPLCQACLFREVKKRTNHSRAAEPAANGPPVDRSQPPS